MATDPTEYVNQEVVVTTIQGDVTGKEGGIVFPDAQLTPNATTKPLHPPMNRTSDYYKLMDFSARFKMLKLIYMLEIQHLRFV